MWGTKNMKTKIASFAGAVAMTFACAAQAAINPDPPPLSNTFKGGVSQNRSLFSYSIPYHPWYAAFTGSVPDDALCFQTTPPEETFQAGSLSFFITGYECFSRHDNGAAQRVYDDPNEVEDLKKRFPLLHFLPSFLFPGVK